MLIKHHEPLGDPNQRQDPLPKNWKDIAGAEAGFIPVRFAAVEVGKLYRSGIVWPQQVHRLQEKYGIAHIISLIEGGWLSDFYEDPSITIHQFPFYQRRELTAKRVGDIVDTINGLEQPALVHCLKGVTKTGMVSAAYQIMNGQKSNLGAFLEYIWRSEWHLSGLVNTSTVREIFYYGDHRS